MKVFSVIGESDSGKTTLISKIIKHLSNENLEIGTIKDIQCENFTIDTKGKDTFVHQQSGSILTTAYSNDETALIYKNRMDFKKLITFYDYDWTIIEGLKNQPVPSVLICKNAVDIEPMLNDRVFAVVLREKPDFKEYYGRKVFHSEDYIEELMNYIKEKVFHLLPLTDCGQCGYDCFTTAGLILKGELTRDACRLEKREIRIKLNGKVLPLSDSEDKLLHDVVLAVIKNIKGFKEHSDIEIFLGKENQ